jgi:UDP-N-acetylmuramoyl-tripeptide--D-alanyl-D-alanine ligase
VLRAGADTDVLVVEMGMRGLGQIAQLCIIARPTVALVTNVGVTHIELLGSQDAVASAKGELVRSLEPDGAAFLNGDDSFSAALAKTSPAPVTYYGLSETCSVRAENIQVDAESRASFDLVAEEGTAHISLTVPGRHNVYNALAAAAIGLHLGVPMDRLDSSLASAEVSAMRMQVFTSADGVTVINDAYNANPVSMQAAVLTLAEMDSAVRRIAVLGDMAELGSLTELAHFRIGESVARLPIDVLVSVGPRAAHIADGARAAGMPADRIHACVTAEEAAAVLRGTLSHNDAVLVKASRVMGLESVVEEIVSPA